MGYCTTICRRGFAPCIGCRFWQCHIEPKSLPLSLTFSLLLCLSDLFSGSSSRGGGRSSGMAGAITDNVLRGWKRQGRDLECKTLTEGSVLLRSSGCVRVWEAFLFHSFQQALGADSHHLNASESCVVSPSVGYKNTWSWFDRSALLSSLVKQQLRNRIFFFSTLKIKKKKICQPINCFCAQWLIHDILIYILQRLTYQLQFCSSNI